ncbi:MAG TPA: hypothetical protein VM285_02610 [Polyangia bacterium]|nr:hypothetical protein [Polyangia bacterium]
MQRPATRHAPARLAVIALALGPAGCLYGTDHDPEDAGLLGADTLGLDLVPGFTEDGIDPPTDTDTGPANSPFDGYDCVNASYYDDVCEYHICQLSDAWDQLQDLCTDGDIDGQTCAQTQACLANYVACLEDHCDLQTGLGNDDLSLCSAGYSFCLDD